MTDHTPNDNMPHDDAADARPSRRHSRFYRLKLRIQRASSRPKPARLSTELGQLLNLFSERTVTLREVIAVLHRRAYTLLLILLALPFCTPIPLPGLSTPFGLVIALIGFRLSLGRRPYLPEKLLNTELPPKFFRKVLAASRHITRAMEWALRPRLAWTVESRFYQHFAGLIILVCGLVLLLPLPIPFSNFLPAITIVLTAAALLERDGFCAIASALGMTATIIFFVFIAHGATELIAWLKHFFHG